jgi:hypothetical protein
MKRRHRFIPPDKAHTAIMGEGSFCQRIPHLPHPIRTQKGGVGPRDFVPL